MTVLVRHQSFSLREYQVLFLPFFLPDLQEHIKERLELQELVVKAASEEARELLKRFDELKALKRHQECQHLQQELENRWVGANPALFQGEELCWTEAVRGLCLSGRKSQG